MRGWRARARPRGDSAVRPLSSEKGGGRRGKCVDTLQWATVRSREKGGGRRGECVDGALERARAAIPPRVL